jgi:uncharacterized PurR-regulated membrane protein YhhQ (DUF165 family)
MLDRLLPGLDRSLALKLVAFHTFIIALSNWLVTIKFDFMGHPLTYAAFTYPLVVVATDLTVRLIGKEMGRAVVAASFIPAIVVSILVVMAGGAPQSIAFRIGLGSGLAYFVSCMLDVYVFQYIREKYATWWYAPAISAVVSTFLDTYVFFGTAFAGGANEFMANNWHIVATNNSISKVLVSLLVILPAYGLLLSRLQKKLASDEENIVKSSN